MANASEKIGQCALYILFLAGPTLGFATKGFAPLMAIAGSLAGISILMQPKQLSQIQFGRSVLALPFLIFIGLSLSWSQSEKGAGSYFILILVIIFTFFLQVTFHNFPPKKQIKFKHWLSASLGLGIIISLAIGSYPIIWPDLPALTSEISNQVTLGNIELVRQSNRSLSLAPVFLFSLAGFYWHKARWLIIPLILCAFIVTAISNSQTAFLAICMGVAAFLFTYFYKYDLKKFAFYITAIGLLASPIVFLKSFENSVVQNYAPEIIKHRASGEYREWIYYTYASEALSKPLVGHGFGATQNFSPINFDEYIKLAGEREVLLAIRQGKINGNLGHAHNLPLQIIFEFGYCGALLFLAAFWWILNLPFGKLNHLASAATLAAICGLLLFSYSIWQSWLLASLGFLYFYISTFDTLAD